MLGGRTAVAATHVIDEVPGALVIEALVAAVSSEGVKASEASLMSVMDMVQAERLYG